MCGGKAMDSEYKDIFERLYQPLSDLEFPNAQYWHFAYAPQNPMADDSVAIRQAIDEAEQELIRSSRRRIRADAKYFLLMNFMEMVFLPMRVRGVRFGGEERYSLLRDDVNLVVDSAARLQAEREQIPRLSGQFLEVPELSGHSVVEAVAFNWKNLKLSDFRIWGED
jgi:hypothetical protein